MKKPFQNNKVMIGILWAVAVLVVSAAINGIIGNRADELLQALIDLIGRALAHDAWPWIVSGVIAILGIVGIALCWLQISVLQGALRQANKMVELDGSLLRLLASWQPTQRRAHQIELLLKEVLLDATTEFDGEVNRASIMLPDVKRDFLRFWVGHNMPPESREDMEFYIGKDQLKRERDGGVAGEAFYSERLLIGHMKRIDNFWVCDLESYKKPRGRRPYPSYRSFVNVPIMGSDPENADSTRCLGVLCFDSQNEKIFDSDEVKEVLLMLASRVAAVILISEQLP